MYSYFVITAKTEQLHRCLNEKTDRLVVAPHQVVTKPRRKSHFRLRSQLKSNRLVALQKQNIHLGAIESTRSKDHIQTGHRIDSIRETTIIRGLAIKIDLYHGFNPTNYTTPTHPTKSLRALSPACRHTRYLNLTPAAAVPPGNALSPASPYLLPSLPQCSIYDVTISIARQPPYRYTSSWYSNTFCIKVVSIKGKQTIKGDHDKRLSAPPMYKTAVHPPGLHSIKKTTTIKITYKVKSAALCFK